MFACRALSSGVLPRHPANHQGASCRLLPRSAAFLSQRDRLSRRAGSQRCLLAGCGPSAGPPLLVCSAIFWAPCCVRGSGVVVNHWPASNAHLLLAGLHDVGMYELSVRVGACTCPQAACRAAGFPGFHNPACCGVWDRCTLSATHVDGTGLYFCALLWAMCC